MGHSGSDVQLALGEDEGREAGKLAAYRAVPSGGRGKGVLVLDEAGSLGEFGREVCDRLARAGFTAVGLDLPRPPVDAAVAAGIQALLDDDATLGSRIGILGFDAGAALWLASPGDLRRVGCIALCGGLQAAERAPGVDVPALLLVGAEGPGADAAPGLASALGGARLRSFPGASEGFMNPARPDRHRATAAAEAWDALLSFLQGSL